MKIFQCIFKYRIGSNLDLPIFGHNYDLKKLLCSTRIGFHTELVTMLMLEFFEPVMPNILRLIKHSDLKLKFSKFVEFPCMGLLSFRKGITAYKGQCCNELGESYWCKFEKRSNYCLENFDLQLNIVFWLI